MKTPRKTIGLTALTAALALTAGCTDPQSGSAIGGLLGTVAGAYIGNANGNMMQGAELGQRLGSQVGGLIGLLNQQQIAYLQQNAPQTYQVIQHDDQVSQDSSQGTMTPVSVTDITQLTAAGVKSDVIIKYMQESQATYSQADLAAAQQTTPAIDPSVISYMQNHVSS